MPSVESIHIAPYASSPMRSIPSASLLADVGIEGDRYADNEGTYSVFRASSIKPGEQEPGRQLTLMSADGAEKALAEAGITIPGGDLGNLRRNVVIRGVPPGTMLSWIGRAVRIGTSAVIFVHRHCVPCMYNERRNGVPGLMEALWVEAGVSCEILVGGEVGVGDDVKLLSEEELQEACPGRTVKVDAGNQCEGFFVRPSQRTTDMVQASLDRKEEDLKELERLDPDGVERLEMSYIGVGLSFWPTRKTEGPAIVKPPAHEVSRIPVADPVTRTGGRGALRDRSTDGHETRRSSDSGAHLFKWDDSQCSSGSLDSLEFTPGE